MRFPLSAQMATALLVLLTGCPKTPTTTSPTPAPAPDDPRIVKLARILRAADRRVVDEDLRVLLTDGDPAVRANAALALGQIADASSLPDLEKAATDTTAETRASAAFALGLLADVAAQERVLREGLGVLERIGDRAYYPTTALSLAKCLYDQERYEEVGPLCEAARETTGADDLVNFVELDGLGGGLLARRGSHDEAGPQARRAVELAETTDFFWTRAWARLMLAETLALAGRMAEASEQASEGLAHYEAKGDVTGAARARERLARLEIEVS